VPGSYEYDNEPSGSITILHGNPRGTMEGNIKMDVTEIGCKWLVG
jgi:hypothetical protein